MTNITFNNLTATTLGGFTSFPPDGVFFLFCIGRATPPARRIPQPSRRRDICSPDQRTQLNRVQETLAAVQATMQRLLGQQARLRRGQLQLLRSVTQARRALSTLMTSTNRSLHRLHRQARRQQKLISRMQMDASSVLTPSPEYNPVGTTHSSTRLTPGYLADKFSGAEPTHCFKIEPTNSPEDDSSSHSVGSSESEEPHEVYHYAPDPNPEQDVLVELLNFYDVRSTAED